MVGKSVLKSARKPGELKVSRHGVAPPFPLIEAGQRALSAQARDLLLSRVLLLREGWRGWKWASSGVSGLALPRV